MNSHVEVPPRSIVLLLEGSRVQSTPWDFAGSDFAGLAGWGGVALGTAWLLERLRVAPDDPALVLAVGECVVRGVPTAARATVMGRAPLSGLFAAGQLGGELGVALAGRADVLALRGKAVGRGAILCLGEGGRARLEFEPELEELSPGEIGGRLAERFGTRAILCTGPGSSLAFASLAAGEDPPSFVGRGGLGRLFHRLGLKALVLEPESPARDVEPDPVAVELSRHLVRSPRAVARAMGGTFELFEAKAARGEEDPERVHEVVARAEARRVDRKGCRGCPTPCGWVFEQDETRRRQGARFSAAEALGSALGLDDFDATLALLARCDALGIDAREAGTILKLALELGEAGRLDDAPRRGDRASLESALTGLLAREHPAREGAGAFASAFGLAHETHHGQSLRVESNLASLLGQCVSGGGVDPMRSLPFLAELGDREAMEELIGLPLPGGAEDPRDPAGKGRIVVWSENLIQAIDATGFCAFSAVGLLADGVLSLDALARFILPRAMLAAHPGEGRSEGELLLALGQELVAMRAEIDAHLGGRSDAPPGLREELEVPGMLPEYRSVRSSARGAWGSLGGWIEEVASWRGLSGPEDRGIVEEPLAEPRPAPGKVFLAVGGGLADVLGRDHTLATTLPRTLEEVVHELVERHPRAGRWLLSDKRLLPAFWRGGERLHARSRVRDGDRLEVVLAISGG